MSANQKGEYTPCGLTDYTGAMVAHWMRVAHCVARFAQLAGGGFMVVGPIVGAVAGAVVDLTKGEGDDNSRGMEDDLRRHRVVRSGCSRFHLEVHSRQGKQIGQSVLVGVDESSVGPGQSAGWAEVWTDGDGRIASVCVRAAAGPQGSRAETSVRTV